MTTGDEPRASEGRLCPHGIPAGIGCSECEKRLDEYRTCQQRGHDSDGNAWTTNVTWYRCKWCGTSYRTETTKTLYEDNKPFGADDDG